MMLVMERRREIIEWKELENEMCFFFFDRVKEKRTNRTWEKEGKKQLNLP